MKNKKNLIADRLSYSIFMIPLPSGASGNIGIVIKSRLASFYPEPLDGKEIRVIKNGSDRTGRIVLVSDREQFKKNLKAVCPALFAMRLLIKEIGVCLFITDTFIEYLTINKGVFVSDSVHSRNNALPLQEQISSVSANPAAVVCGDEDIQTVQRLFAGARCITFGDIRGRAKNSALFSVLTPEHRKKEFFLFLLMALLVITAGALCMYRRAIVIADALVLEKNTAEMRIRQEKERKDKEQLLKDLNKEYTAYAEHELPDVFDVCKFIFTGIDSSVKIENMSVAGSVFQFDARGKDAITILTQYEQNDFVSSIQLNRVVVEESQDVFSFSGTVRRLIQYPDSCKTIDEQIEFYQDGIEACRQADSIKRARSPSEISGKIRNMFDRNGCRIEMIQYYNTEFGLEIEYAVRAGSSGFFAFLEAVSNKDVLIDISSVRIRNNREGSSISAAIRFRTGIAISDGGVQVLPDKESEITAEELSAFFVRPVDRKPDSPVFQKPDDSEPIVIKNQGCFVYLGAAGTSKGEAFVLIKDVRKNTILKLTSLPAEGNYVIYNNPGEVEVMYEGNIYEVKK